MTHDQINNLEELRKYLAERGDLSEAARRDMRSAINVVAKALGQPPRALPCDSTHLRERLENVHPQQLEFSTSHWQNMRSKFRQALTLVQPPHLRDVGMAERWQALHDDLKARGEHKPRYHLSGFMRFCSLKGVKPEDVTADTFSAFYEYKKETDLSKNPATVYQYTSKAWNVAVDRVPEWPGERVTRPSDFERTKRPLKDFPKTFEDDLAAMRKELQLEPEDDEDCPSLASTTADQIFDEVHRLADWLVHNAYLRDNDVHDVATVCTASHVKAYVRTFTEPHRKPEKMTAATITGRFITAARWAGLPDEDVRRLRQIAANKRPQNQGMSKKSRDRVSQFDRDINKHLILNLPDKLIHEASDVNYRPKRAKHDVFVAAVIALLTRAPLRLKNVSNLKRSQIRWPTKKTQDGYLYIDGDDTKNGDDLHYILPPHVMDALRVYLTYARPTWLTPNDDRLFPWNTENDNENYFRELLEKRIKAHTGITMHPHLFRHFAAKLYLDRNPDDPETARNLLGHRKIETTTSFYRASERRERLERYDQTVLGEQDELRQQYGHHKDRTNRQRHPQRKRRSRSNPTQNQPTDGE